MKNRIKHRVNQRQRFGIKTLVILGATGTLLFAGLMTIFYYGDIRKTKAQGIQFTRVEDQVFTNEMALPAPIIRTHKVEGSETIQTQQIKSSEATTTNNE